MPELGTYGSVRGAPSNGRPYRDRCACAHRHGPWTTLAALPTARAFAHMPTAFDQ